MDMSKSQKTINLALQGGGTHGALAWGILDRLLEEKHLVFDSISATSAGALNAAVLVNGMAKGGREGGREALHEFWEKTCEVGQIYNPIRLLPWEEFWKINIEHSMMYFWCDFLSKVFSPYQFNPSNFNPLRNTLDELLDIEMIRSSHAPKLFITATNVRTGKIKIFDNKEISLDAIIASACLPFLFQAVQIKDDYYWDGGYLGNPALYPLIYHSQCCDILILHINPIYREQIPHTAASILDRVNEISFNSSLMREMRAISFVTELLDNGWIKEEYRHKMKRLFVHAIRADISMQSFSVASKLNPDWSFIKGLYEQGRQEAEFWIKNNFRHVNNKSSIDINEYL
jgi:NTE family protein